MPKLASFIEGFCVKLILKIRIPLADFFLEGMLIFQLMEVKWITRREDRSLFGKVSVVRVIETIYTLSDRGCSRD